jgi:succinate dehydrogenase / fumarate reductase, membrane anchor subunit
MFRNAFGWYMQRITGGLLLILLTAHFWVEHFMTAPARRGDLTYQVILARISSPVWQAIDISFLVIALYHGLCGLRNIIIDYGRLGQRSVKVLNVALVLTGALWAWWGISAFSHL